MAEDGSKTFDKILKGAKVAGAVAVEGVLAATGTHPSLKGNDDWSLINKARGKTKKGEGLGKSDEIGRPKNARSMDDILSGKGDKKKSTKGKLAKAALGALAGGTPAPLPDQVQYMPTAVSFSPVHYTGGRPTRTKEEYSKGSN